MKQPVAIFFIVLVILATGGVAFAQTTSPTRVPVADQKDTANDISERKEATGAARPTTRPASGIDQKDSAVKELKEKIESKVSELKDRNQRTSAGFVTALKDKVLTVRTENGDIQVELDEDVTEVFRIDGTKTAELKIDDIKKGDYILVTGPEIGTTVTANRVYVDEHFIVRSGTIIEVNSESFYVRVQTVEKETYTLDIERNTTQQLVDIKTLELSKIGFSKLKEGDSIHFTARRGIDPKQTRFSASSVVIVPQEYFIKE
ncbi:MAG: hypothetical protein N2691_01640 [Patescibacteria group bacterium]|nr:hypothetical protein [Patescibacteria group bacterium]